MSDLHAGLDREAKRIHEDANALEHVRRRADRQRRTRRVAAGVVGLTIAAGSLGLAFIAFRPSDQTRPADEQKARQIHPEGPTVYLDNRSEDEDVSFAASIVLNHIFVASLSTDGTPRDVLERSRIKFLPEGEAAARELRRRYLPGAEISPGQLAPPSQRHSLAGGPPDVSVLIGSDYADLPLGESIGAYKFVARFTEARTAGEGAEAYLSEDATSQYENHEGGLVLYTPGLIISGLRPTDHTSYEAKLELGALSPEGTGREILQIEGGQSKGFWVIAAQRLAGPSAPQSGPSAGPTPTNGQETSNPSSTLEVLNATGQDLSQVASYIVLRFRDAARQRGVLISVISDAEEGQFTSQILCDAAHRSQAAEIEQALLPGAEIGDLPTDAQSDMQIVLGQDFGNRERDGIQAYELVHKFMAARHEGQGAERFLAEEAARQYGESEGGLSLYDYYRRSHDITGIHRLPGEPARFAVVVRIPQSRDSDFYETLNVGRADDSDGSGTSLFIVYAERNE